MKLTTNEQAAIQQIEAILKQAQGEGCGVCRILTTVCANHLFSSLNDECHVNGLDFGKEIDEYAAEYISKSKDEK